jgi:hypothetical protein
MRRKAQRERAAARAAAGLPPKVQPRKSRYKTDDIREEFSVDTVGVKKTIYHQPWAPKALLANHIPAPCIDKRTEFLVADSVQIGAPGKKS